MACSLQLFFLASRAGEFLLCTGEPAGQFRIAQLSTEEHMPRGDKSSYTSKQKRMAQHIEEGYEKRGVPSREADKRAWATVNKATGGAGKAVKNKSPMKKGGKKGGARGGRKSSRQIH
jgi:hypothetical protein